MANPTQLPGSGSVPQAGANPGNGLVQSLVNMFMNFSGGNQQLQKAADLGNGLPSSIPEYISQPQPSHIAEIIKNLFHQQAAPLPTSQGLQNTQRYLGR